MFQKKYNGLLFEKIGLLVTERYSIIIKEEYDCIDKVSQTNYYFDTEDFILTQDKLTMKLK